MTRRVSLAGSVQIASGLPVTLPSGARVAALKFVDAADGGVILTPFVFVLDPKAGPLVGYEDDYGSMNRINGTRLPASSRVDFRATLHPKNPSGRWTFYLDVINVLNHRNQLSVFSDLAYNPSGPRPLVEN